MFHVPQDSLFSISEHELLSPVDSHKREKVPCHTSPANRYQISCQKCVIFVTGLNYENQIQRHVQNFLNNISKLRLFQSHFVDEMEKIVNVFNVLLICCDSSSVKRFPCSS